MKLTLVVSVSLHIVVVVLTLVAFAVFFVTVFKLLIVIIIHDALYSCPGEVVLLCKVGYCTTIGVLGYYLFSDLRCGLTSFVELTYTHIIYRQGITSFVYYTIFDLQCQGVFVRTQRRRASPLSDTNFRP